MKTVIVCCGYAMATSTMLENEVGELLRRNGIESKIIKCMAAEVQSFLNDGKVDLIIPSGRYNFDTDVPVISGTAYITGVGKEKVEAKILEALRD